MSRIETLLSKQNSTEAPLAANEVFNGQIDDLSSFQEIDITVAGAPDIAPGVFFFEFSPNGIKWDISVPIVLTGPSMTPLPLRVILPKFRVRYENGVTPLTELRVTTILHRTGAKPLTRFLNQPLRSDEPVEVVRSITTGINPTGLFKTTPITEDGLAIPVADALVPGSYDHISLGYTGSDLTTVTYRKGGPSGTVISILTLGYSGGNLVSVARS